MNEIMSRVRPEEWIIFMPSEARLKIFLKNYKIIKIIKFIV